jgi:hypothetical protein
MKHYIVNDNYEVEEFCGEVIEGDGKYFIADPSLSNDKNYKIGQNVFLSEKEAYLDALKEIRKVIKNLQCIEEKIVNEAIKKEIFNPSKPNLKDIAKDLSEME